MSADSDSTAQKKLASNMQSMYDMDLSRLPDMVRLARTGRAVSGALALVADAAERDARVKLRRATGPGWSPSRARMQAWATTRGLRIATAAMRQASAQLVSYRAELDKNYVALAREQRRRDKKASSKSAKRDGFDVLGGV